MREYNVEEGERTEVTCTADGNPEPTKFEWNSVNTGGAQLVQTAKFRD